MNFGKTILELRKRNQITQEAMAAELGVTAAAVSKWENNYTLPDVLMLCAIADYFGVTTDELLGRHVQYRYAVVAAQTMELGDQIKALAKRYGIQAKSVHTDYMTALAAAKADAAVEFLVMGFTQNLTEEEHEADCADLWKLVSQHQNAAEVLDGMQWVFENCLPSIDDPGRRRRK